MFERVLIDSYGLPELINISSFIDSPAQVIFPAGLERFRTVHFEFNVRRHHAAQKMYGVRDIS